MAIATLSIDIVARLASLEAGMQRAERIVAQNAERMDSRFKTAGASLAKLGALAAVSFASAGVVGFLRNTVDGLDALNDAADATGSTVEQLSALEDVAARTGTSFETVESILVRFNKVLSDATPGSAAEASLRSLGLRAEELRRVDPAEAVQRTAQALEAFAPSGTKARTVQELFGKSVREAAPFLKDLAEAGQLNATVTRAQAEEAERFNKNLSALSKNATDFARVLSGPVIQAINERIEAIRALGGVGAALSNLLGFDDESKLKRQATFVSQDLERAIATVERLQEALNRDRDNTFLAMRLEKARERVAALSAEASKASDALKGLAQGLDPINAAGGGRGFVVPTRPLEVNEKLDQRMRMLQDELNKTQELSAVEQQRLAILREELGKLSPLEEQRLLRLARQVDLMRIDTRNPTVDIPEIERARRDGLQTVDFPDDIAAARRDRQQQLNALIEATPIGQYESLVRQQRLLNEAYAEGSISAEKYAQATQQINDQVVSLDPTLRDMAERAQQVSADIQATLGDNVVSVLQNDFQSIGRAWTNLLNRMLAEAISKQLGSALGLGGGAGSLFGLFGGAGGAGGGAAAPIDAGITPMPGIARAVPPALGKAAQGVTFVTNVASGVQRPELQAAVQVGMQAVEARLVRRLQTAGVI